MTTFPVPATVVIGVMVGLIIVANILSRNSSRPSGLRGGLLAILAVGGMVAVFVYGPRLWQPLPSSSTPAHAAAVAAPGQLRSAPSLSADFIDQVLAVNQSPAQGLGTTLSQLSQSYGIDDALALAQFHHESTYGKEGVARITHSLGNMKCSAGYICDPSGTFRSYATWEDGAKDWYQLMTTVYLPRGLDTVDKEIAVYAPSSDGNDEQASIHAILSDITRWRAGEV